MNPASCGCVGLHSPPGEMPLGCVLGRNKTLQPRLCASCPVCSCSSGWQLWNTSAYGFNCSSKRSAVFCNARHLHCSPSANRAEQLWNKRDLSFLKAIKDGRYFSQHCAWCLLAFGFRYDLIRVVMNYNLYGTCCGWLIFRMFKHTLIHLHIQRLIKVQLPSVLGMLPEQTSSWLHAFSSAGKRQKKAIARLP